MKGGQRSLPASDEEVKFHVSSVEHLCTMIIRVFRFPAMRFAKRVDLRRLRRPGRFRSTQLPWEFGFQLNERYLKWNDSAQAQLVKLVVQDKLQLSRAQLQMRLNELTVILPDLTERLETLTAPLLSDLLRDPDEIANRVLLLKTLLPNLDLGQAVRRYPELVARHTASELEEHVNRLRDAFDGDVFQVGELLTKEPRCLKVDVDEVLKVVKRLLPDCPDPMEVFKRYPGQFLSMEQMGLESTN